MIKRTESHTPSKKRRDKKRGVNKRRRMMMESLEQRQLLAAEVFDLPSVTLPVYEQSRDIGTVEAFAYSESEPLTNTGGNDTFQTADYVPLGTAAGKQATIDITGTLPFTTTRPPIVLPDGTIIPQTFSADLDYFSFDLRAGDILDIATLSAAGSYTVFHPDGTIWYGIDDNQSATGFFPTNSPLQTLGNAVYAQVVPEDGRYTIMVAPNNVQTNYTVGLRVYRPSVESLPIGAQQYVFLDFDGAVVPNTIFDDGTGVPQTGTIRVPTLIESLPYLGLEALDTASIDRLIDLTIEETIRQNDHLGLIGNAGDYDRTGVPGDYGITVLNSRDHVDPGNHPLVTRVLVGGPISNIGFPDGVLGVSTTIDIGNFSMNDNVFVALDGVVGAATSVPIANNSSVLESTADLMAFIITHEIGHSFGMRHTEPGNTTDSIADAIIYTTEGPDGIYGTLDDVQANYADDQFRIIEGIYGTNHIVNALANTLVTGTVGSSVSGVVFNDANSDGNQTGDAGLPGVTVFVDLDGDGALDVGEPSAVSASDGSFSLSGANGTRNVVALTPSQYASTTPTSVSVNFGSTSAISFGFTQTIPDVSGMKFADLNDNGVMDDGEGGIEDVYIYVDLDTDDRPDLGEPSSLTAADGTFAVNLPGPGSYSIREVVEPGFTQTLPTSGEYTVIYDGTTYTVIDGPFQVVAGSGIPVATGNSSAFDGTNTYIFASSVLVNQGSQIAGLNFGNSPSRDYGDAPDNGVQYNYRTLSSNDGASHGIVSGLSLGAAVDRDLNGFQSVDALGDDISGALQANGGVLDDEDGVAALSEPFGLGATNTLSISATNTTGSPAYLQAWMDFNLDGDFDDAGEQIATNLELGTGTIDLPVTVPADAAIGTTYARFRYSQSRDVDWFGSVDTGEVEDYAFPILASTGLANDDSVVVSRNSLAVDLTDLVLDNDFNSPNNPLTIVAIQTVVDANGAPLDRNTRGVVRLNGGQISYTPPTGYIGLDQFAYKVRDTFGREALALVSVNVNFLSDRPIAVDDIFEVPEGSVNRALNVLDNDVPSTAGGLTIVSTLPGSQGGSISIVGGGQSLRYTPLPNFTGTEQFIYNVQDSAGLVSSATVTVNMLPGSRADDIVDFTIEILDTENQRPISSVPVGEEFFVRVYVEDLQAPNPLDGVASAFLDLLYSDTQVAVLPKPAGSTSAFDFDIDFGPLFQGFVVNDFDTDDPDGTNPFQQGNAAVPGLLNEIGALQTTIPNREHDGPTELFTVRMQAVAPGVAIFQGDPANNIVSETVVVGSDVALEPSQMRFGTAELEIRDAGTVFSSAIDDSFPDNLDSLGQSFANSAVTTYRLDVLDNDILGPTGRIIDRQILAQGGLGQAVFNDNGTVYNPVDASTLDALNDDYIEYTPNIGTSGFETFTYFIVTEDGIRSTAEVTLAINDSADDLVDINFVLVDQAGDPISATNGIVVGDVFGVQVNLLDLRGTDATSVFAGYLDMLYTSELISTINTTTDPVFGNDNFDFDVLLDEEFQANAAVGTARRAGIIDEFGAFLTQQVAESQSADVGNLMATVYFRADASGTARVVGSPADSFPFQDTLLSLENDPVPVNQIRYDVLTFNISGPSGEFIQNPARPADVNNDGDISPLDALLVLNRLALEAQNGQGEETSSTQQFLDVSGNGELSPLDALMVLNALADQRSQSQFSAPQGEAIGSPIARQNTLADDTDEVATLASDTVFAELNQPTLTNDHAASSSPAAAAPVALTDPAVDSEDDADQLLNLLADDLLGLGN